ncbi:MAG: sll0787 family AIR synthase-like protein [Betaproteobacteria bacterium]|nr:sll0787 family AIR synthase-like protein [Betaproteobacteria bacterium]
MLDEIAAALRASRGLAHKSDIAAVMRTLALGPPSRVGGEAVPIGDDCAAIRDGDGWLLFAIEGLLNEFVQREPWFAGYCAVMVNLSDVYAMGGRPIAVVDAVWTDGLERAAPIVEGMNAAARAYGVPIVGGHTNCRSNQDQLAAAVLGRTRHLLTSFDARPGDVLLAAIDQRGRYREPYPYWDASTESDARRLRADLELLPGLAEAGLCAAAKDVSMAGIVGTAMMLLECSGLGGEIDVAAVPKPSGVASERWLVSTFPSYGFILAASAANVAAVVARFAARGIACAPIGHCDASRAIRVAAGGRSLPVWNFAEAPLIGCGHA